jgi:ElaB/YqjD/DUF883 family membrane-anchored ribosome-binding protein
MDNETQALEARIEETKSDLNENLLFLEDKIKQRVDTAKRAVSDAIESVKEEAQKLSPVYQTKAHPFAAVGTAVTVGIVLGNLLARKDSSTSLENQGLSARTSKESFFEVLTPLREALSPEVRTVKTAALEAILDFAGKTLSGAVPHLAPQIAELTKRVQERLEKGKPPTQYGETGF